MASMPGHWIKQTARGKIAVELQGQITQRNMGTCVSFSFYQFAEMSIWRQVLYVQVQV